MDGATWKSVLGKDSKQSSNCSVAGVVEIVVLRDARPDKGVSSLYSGGGDPCQTLLR